MLCLAVAVISCGKCINAHENILRENNISKLHIQTVAPIAIINAIAKLLLEFQNDLSPLYGNILFVYLLHIHSEKVY